MAKRQWSPERDVQTARSETGTAARPTKSSSGGLIARSVKAGKFTGSEIKQAIRAVISERTTGCQTA
jgi:hypothetical protein